MIRSILIAQGAFGAIYEPAWVRALNELGIKTTLFDAHRLTLPSLLGRIERRILWGPGIQRIHKKLLTQVQQERPDILLLYQGHYFPAHIIQRLREHTYVVGLHNDDPFGTRQGLLRYRHLLPALPFYQGFHVYRPVNIAEARARGIANVGLLMPYFIPWLDYPRTLTAAQQKRWGCDVLFAGHSEQDMRIDCITQAARQEIPLRVYGGERRWQSALPADVYDRVGPTPALGMEDYRLALCGAKIGTCFFSKWNRDEYTRRVFEIPACGLFLLSERTSRMAILFKEGQEADFFSSTEEFIEKTRFYLHNDDLRARIAAAGRRRVLSDGHDIHARLRQWLRDVTTWRQATQWNPHETRKPT